MNELFADISSKLKPPPSHASRPKFKATAVPMRDTAKLPVAGQAEGGHPHVMQKNAMRQRILNLTGQPAFMPLKIIMAATLAAAATKVFILDPAKPNQNFDKRDRKTLDFIENNKNVTLARQYTNSSVYKGPFNKSDGRVEILGMVPSDKKLEPAHLPSEYSQEGEKASLTAAHGNAAP